MDRTTEQLVDFASRLRFDDLSEAAVTAAKARILSALAVALAAYDMAPVAIARRMAQPVAAGPAASVLGDLTRTTPDMAAFVNSAMVRSLDMSDTLVAAGTTHPADAFPALLAVAEAEQRDGRSLLLATAIAYEVQCRFADAVPCNHHGWDQTPVVALGAALGCARLLELRKEQMAHCVALAVVPNIALNQTRTGMLSMWKGMAGPQGARAGVFAAYLAREGMTGPDGVFEGEYGFWNQLMDGHACEVAFPATFDGHTFAVQRTMIKSFPTRFNCQVPVFAAQKLRGMVDYRDIESLRIESIRQAFERWMHLPEIWKPETRETADHSLPCTVAMALIDGTITPAMMEQARYKDTDVRTLMGRCTIELPQEFADIAPAVRACRLTAAMRDGGMVVAEYRRSAEDDTADPAWDQAADKFRTLTRDILRPEAARGLLSAVQSLERLPGMDGIVQPTSLKRT
jgi:2-methylcitrate dehydratase